MSIIHTEHGDLFDLIPEIRAERHHAAAKPLIDALTCLRDSITETLQIVTHLEYWQTRDKSSPRKNGNWAYIVCAKGIRHQPVDTWTAAGGWNHTPDTLTTWQQLRELLHDDPRRNDVTAWAASLTAIDKWKDLTRPHELWPHPETWHPSYIEGDQERPGYRERMRAWNTTLQILTDTITRLEAA